MFDKITGFVADALNNTGSVASGKSGFFSLPWYLILLIILVVIGVYVYFSFTLMKISQKTKTEPYWLAWVPVGDFYLLSRIAKMHWWPVVPGVIGFIFSILGYVFFFLPVSSPEFNTPLSGILIFWSVLFFLGLCLTVVFSVFFYIWFWKTFEAVGKPGWWVLMGLIPYVGILILLVLLGIIVWEKPSNKIK